MNVTPRRPSTLPACLLVGGLFAACGPGAAGDAGRTAAQDTASPRALTATSSSGVRVRLSLEPSPPRPGPVHLEISLPEGLPGRLPVTVDLVSPEMPAHGVVRYEAVAGALGTFRAVVELPMEGHWELYVNLDYGADAARFDVHVSAGGEAPSHHHTG